MKRFCTVFCLLLLVAVTAVAQQPDNEYTKKIKEYTTEPYFRTELVDHLPMSDKVPSPDKVLGYIVGTPNKLTYTKDSLSLLSRAGEDIAARARVHRSRNALKKARNNS